MSTHPDGQAVEEPRPLPNPAATNLGAGIVYAAVTAYLLYELAVFDPGGGVVWFPVYVVGGGLVVGLGAVVHLAVGIRFSRRDTDPAERRTRSFTGASLSPLVGLVGLLTIPLFPFASPLVVLLAALGAGVWGLRL